MRYSTDGTVVWTDNYNGNLDIYLDNVGAPANDPPGAPTITGPDDGDAGTVYEFTFSAVDPDDDDIYYLLDWGDGFEDVIGLFPSGTEAYASHTWAEKGSYLIKAKAVDPYNAESDWGQLSFNVPRNRAFSNSYTQSFLRQLQNNFQILRYLLKL